MKLLDSYERVSGENPLNVPALEEYDLILCNKHIIVPRFAFRSDCGLTVSIVPDHISHCGMNIYQYDWAYEYSKEMLEDLKHLYTLIYRTHNPPLDSDGLW